MKVNKEIELKNPKYCEGCPFLDIGDEFEELGCLLGYANKGRAWYPKERAIECINENGV